MNVLVSVVVVTLNAEQYIKKTIESILYQDYSTIEVVFIDACSDDGTNVLIENYYPEFQERGILYTHIIEKDMGIFDAMNKGVKHCTGEWVLFLNAGDWLCSEGVFSPVFSNIYDSDLMLIYGDSWNVKGDSVIYRSALDLSNVLYRVAFIHQASFVRREAIKQFRFDLEYRFLGDYDLAIRLYMANVRYLRIKHPIVYYSLDGASNDRKNRKMILQELRHIYKKNDIRNLFQIKRLYYWKISPILKNVAFIRRTYSCLKKSG